MSNIEENILKSHIEKENKNKIKLKKEEFLKFIENVNEKSVNNETKTENINENQESPIVKARKPRIKKILILKKNYLLLKI